MSPASPKRPCQVQARKTAEVKHANGKVQKKSQADQSVKASPGRNSECVELFVCRCRN